MGKRYTFFDVGKQGQERPYGDSIYTQRLMVERQEENGTWVPFDVIEDRIRDILKANQSTTGFTDYVYKKEDGQGGYFRRRFVYLMKISPGVWEHRTLRKFCD